VCCVVCSGTPAQTSSTGAHVDASVWCWFGLYTMHLRAVLTRLREHQLYVKATKCEWLQTSI
jgi:hypothetical protein